ncbi:MAG: PepSY domain-containing protein, partial [Pseudomonas protegens]
WIKLIWFFFGLVLSMMVLSGLLIWTKRTALATANALKREEKAARARPASKPAQAPAPAMRAETSESTL